MNVRAALAVVALGLGALAAATAEPADRQRAALMAAAGESRVDVLTVARWLRAREPGLILVEVGSAGEGGGPSLPGALHRTIADLDTMGVDRARRLVVYADTPALAAQAWLVLRLAGHLSVSYLDDGVRDWVDGVLSPVLPDSATADERAVWPVVAELSRYFGGLPSRGGPRPPGGRLAWFAPAAALPADSRAPVRRVGCGF